MIDELINSLDLIIAQTQNNKMILAVILAVPWFIFFVTYFINNRLLLLGIIPRHLLGLPGILFAPCSMLILTIFFSIRFPYWC